MEEQKVKLTEKQLFDKLVTLFGEVALLQEDVKELKAQVKEEGMEASRIGYISAIAKAKAECKLEDKVEKNREFNELAEEFA